MRYGTVPSLFGKGAPAASKEKCFPKKEFSIFLFSAKTNKKGLTKRNDEIVEVRAIDLEPQAFIWNAVL